MVIHFALLQFLKLFVSLLCLICFLPHCCLVAIPVMRMTLSEKTCVGKIAFLISFQIPAVLSFVHFLKTSVCEGWVLAAELMNPDLQELRTEQEKIV